ncbi:hypothetical protein HK104_001930 [Borealophlyctis nickersoniae]|nr:hypothetical protein HK104_001930 [Borealophlyctis nickersoniae]
MSLNQIIPPHAPSLHLYRRALRIVKNTRSSSQPPQYPKPFQRKFYANVRELFEVYRSETDPQVVQRLIENGQHDVEVVEALTKVEALTGTRLWSSWNGVWGAEEEADNMEPEPESRDPGGIGQDHWRTKTGSSVTWREILE